VRNTRFLAVTVAAAVMAPSSAAEPQVRFAVEEGWVVFIVTRDDQPVRDAQVIVLDSTGWRFAEGDTGTTGTGLFPMPPGPEFTVEIRIDNRTAEPIRLTPDGDRVFPAAVLLSFGLSPCCRTPPRAAPEPDPGLDPFPLWLQVVGCVTFNALGLAALWAYRRSAPPFPRTAPKEIP
jgi:hypothetical protein